jgi:hypothetical protein
VAFHNSPAQPPELTPELIERFRITTFEIGTLGNWRINNYMIHESDALVLTRTALGEAPDSLPDREYVMWLIRIRAALGYKNGRWNFSGTVDRWGMPSTIKMEALCVGGCQFEPWKAATYVLHPSKLSPTSNLRLMLHPTDEQLPLFFETYLRALDILEQPITDAPEPMRGYDGFRSPTVSDTHYRDWKPNGLLRTQFFEGGNVWVDHAKEDNRFWDLLPGRLALTASATPSPTDIPTSTPTNAPSPTSTPRPSATPTPEAVLSVWESGPPTTTEREEQEMDFLRLVFQQLTEGQISQLSMLVLVIIQAGKIIWVGALKRPKPTLYQMRFVVFVLSFPIGFIFARAELPVWDGDPMAFANAILAYGTVILIQAGLVYDFALKGVAGWIDDKLLGGKTVLAP